MNARSWPGRSRRLAAVGEYQGDETRCLDTRIIRIDWAGVGAPFSRRVRQKYSP